MKSPNEKYIKASTFLLETIGADLVSTKSLQRAAVRAGIDPNEVIAAMEWLGVGKDSKGRFFLPSQLVVALYCPRYHRT